MKKIISILAACSIVLGTLTAMAAAPTSYGPYDFDSYAPADTNVAPTGFRNVNCAAGMPYGLSAEDGAVKITSNTERQGVGIGRDYGEVLTSGYTSDEFDIKFGDFSVERVIQTRSTTAGATATKVADVSTDGELMVYDGSSSAKATGFTFTAGEWYRVKIVYLISSAVDKSYGKTYIEVYKSGNLLTRQNGRTYAFSSSPDDTAGKLRYLYLYHNNAAASVTYIDNWESETGELYRNYYSSFDSASDIKSGAHNTAGLWTIPTAGTYSVENGVLNVKVTTKTVNTEYNLLNIGNSDYEFSTEKGSSFEISTDVSFPDFNSQKSFIVRTYADGSFSSALTYARISAGGKLLFPTTDTGVTLAVNTYYNFSFKYNMASQYGYLTVTNKSTREVVYDSSAIEGKRAAAISGILGKAGISVASVTEGTSEFNMDSYLITETPPFSEPEFDKLTTVDFEDSTLSYRDYMDVAPGSNVTTNEITLENGALKFTLNEDNYAYVGRTISDNLNYDNYVLKASVKMNAAATGATMAMRTQVSTEEFNSNNIMMNLVHFDNEAKTISVYDAELGYVVGDDAAVRKAEKKFAKKVGTCEADKWYDIEVTVDKTLNSYNAKITSGGVFVAFGEGKLTGYDTNPERLIISNGDSNKTDKLSGAVIYIDNVAYGKVNTAKLPSFTEAKAEGSDIVLSFDGYVDPSSVAAMTINGEAISDDMISSTDGKNVKITWLQPNTAYTVSGTAKSFYGKALDSISASVTTGAAGFERKFSDIVCKGSDGSTAAAFVDISGGTLTASVKTQAGTPADEKDTFVLIAAAYNAEGELITTESVPAAVLTTPMPASLNISIPDEAAKATVFLWDGENLRPVKNPVSFAQ